MEHRISLIRELGAVAVCLSLAASAGCSGTEGQPAATGGVPSSGGTANMGQGGASNATGGTVGTGGNTGGMSTGGASTTGGASAMGGTSTGGTSAGSSGMSSGGASLGGTGGSSSGGTGPASGGKNGTGGSAGQPGSGGAASGGAAGSHSGGMTTGGSPATGGQGGGTSTGGSASSNCPSTALASGNTTKSISISGKSRSYVLHVPSGYNGTKAVPLILDFHGLGGSGSGEQSSSPYPAVTDPDGAIMAFPTGLAGPSGNAWNVGPCCVDNTDDVAFAKAIVAEIETLGCVDPKHVYAVGFSMGGGMSHYLACHAADVFAAVAPAAFDLLQENVADCKPPRPITVVSFRGTSDPIVPYTGGASSVVSGHPVTFLGAVNTFKKWAEIDGCTGSASDAGDGCQTYTQCMGGVELLLCTKQGGGHEAGNAKVAWPVLKRHALP